VKKYSTSRANFSSTANGDTCLRLSNITADSVLWLFDGWQWESKFSNLRERFSAMLVTADSTEWPGQRPKLVSLTRFIV